MATEIPELGLVKVLDDPWTADDANAAPRISERYQEAFTGPHHDDEGRHHLPAAQAYVIVELVGGVFTVIAQEGLDPTYGIGGIQDEGTGELSIKLERQMRSDKHWMVVAEGVGGEPHPAMEYPFLKSSQTTRVRMWITIDPPTLGHVRLALEVYGEYA